MYKYMCILYVGESWSWGRLLKGEMVKFVSVSRCRCSCCQLLTSLRRTFCLYLQKIWCTRLDQTRGWLGKESNYTACPARVPAQLISDSDILDSVTQAQASALMVKGRLYKGDIYLVVNL